MQNDTKQKKGNLFLNILFMQAAVVVYTMNSVMNKQASIVRQQEGMTMKYFLFLGSVVVILGIYAILWQQIIKKFKLSVAYANRSMSLLWTMVWSILIFKEGWPSVRNIIGVVMVIVGVILVNSDTGVREEHEAEGGTIE